jgi:hypothetical protein
MKLILPSSNAFEIKTSHVYLRGGWPFVNSLILQDAQGEVILMGRQILRYWSPALGIYTG